MSSINHGFTNYSIVYKGYPFSILHTDIGNWVSQTSKENTPNTPLEHLPAQVQKTLQEWDRILQFLEEKYPENEATTEIDLSYQGFKGMLPPHIAERYPNLRNLNLSHNNFHSIPLELQKLPLTRLNLEGNECLGNFLDSPDTWLNGMKELDWIAPDGTLKGHSARAADDPLKQTIDYRTDALSEAIEKQPGPSAPNKKRALSEESFGHSDKRPR